MSWMDLLSVWTNRQSLPSSMMSEYPKYVVLPCSNISSIEGAQFTLGLSKFKNPCLHFKALWIHVSIEVIRRILCLREMWIQSHVPTSIWDTHVQHVRLIGKNSENRLFGMAWCLPADPSVGVCEVLLQDVLLRRWDWMPDRKRERERRKEI